MLVLSRKKDQSIQVGAGIIVTVLSVTGRCVKLGITAPAEVRIVRCELLAAQPASQLETVLTDAVSVEAEVQIAS